MSEDDKITDEEMEAFENTVVQCYACGVDVKIKDSFVDDFFVKIFGSVFCSKECRDDYINSK